MLGLVWERPGSAKMQDGQMCSLSCVSCNSCFRLDTSSTIVKYWHLYTVTCHGCVLEKWSVTNGTIPWYTSEFLFLCHYSVLAVASLHRDPSALTSYTCGQLCSQRECMYCQPSRTTISTWMCLGGACRQNKPVAFQMCFFLLLTTTLFSTKKSPSEVSLCFIVQLTEFWRA